MDGSRRLSEGALTAMELAAIDMAIFAKQAAGLTVGGLGSDDDDGEEEPPVETAVTPAEMAADRAEDRWEARHGGELDMTDAVVIEYVTSLSTRLVERADLGFLVALRTEALAGPR